MHDDVDFLAAVAANPTDQLTRLVYAEWLDERDDPRGELVRIEEEVRFEPAWSEVLWRQKPRRNELRAACDPAWLAAMRYGTDCLPLFYGRPFPDHWRDGWRLIREATERWLGVPMPDIGGHADEVAAVEKRLGLTLPPSVRERIAFPNVLPRGGRINWDLMFQEPFLLEMASQRGSEFLILQEETPYRWGVRIADIAEDDPLMFAFWCPQAEDEYIPAEDEEPVRFSRFLFNYLAPHLSNSYGLLSVPVLEMETVESQLRSSFPFCSDFGNLLWFENLNITAVLAVVCDTLDVWVSRPIASETIPQWLWDLTAGRGGFGGLFRDHRKKNQP